MKSDETAYQELFEELEKYENKGVYISMDGFPASPMQIVAAHMTREEGSYMRDYILDTVLWSSIFVTLMANKIGGLQFGIYRNCQISSRVFHTAVAALPLTKANRSDFE